MKIFKIPALAGAAIMVLLCSVAVSPGFNPQPEPPGAEQMQPPAVEDTVKVPGTGPVESTREGLTETNPDNFKIRPQFSQTITDTKPLGLEGSGEMPKQGDDVSPGDSKTETPGEGSAPGMKSQKRYNRQLGR